MLNFGGVTYSTLKILQNKTPQQAIRQETKFTSSNKTPDFFHGNVWLVSREEGFSTLFLDSGSGRYPTNPHQGRTELQTKLPPRSETYQRVKNSLPVSGCVAAKRLRGGGDFGARCRFLLLDFLVVFCCGQKVDTNMFFLLLILSEKNSQSLTVDTCEPLLLLPKGNSSNHGLF